MRRRWGSRLESAEAPIESRRCRRKRPAFSRQRSEEMTFGSAMREPVEIAAQGICRSAGPIERQQRRGKLRIAQQNAAVLVDQQRPDDERLRGLVRVVAALPKAVNDSAEARDESPIFDCDAVEVPAA